MKKILTIVLLTLATISQAQNLPMIGKENSTRHKGFFLSMALGASKLNMDVDYERLHDFNFSGSGAIFDIKIGGTIARNLMLHGTLLSENLTGYKAKSSANQTEVDLSSDNTITTSMTGVGITYYTDQNWYMSSSIGYTNLTFEYEDRDDYSPSSGLGFQLKAGKEWWVGPRWGLGFGVYYNYLGIHSDLANNVSEDITANNFGVVFNATLNGKRSHKIR
ncbi:MAG: hypothetical protein N4A59_08780 [Marinifilum sp.]|nr:hypothetical protein [Marinifilum sp.]